MRVTSITPMKNEGPYIVEWVAYHRMLGINDMLVFTNDCDDGTDQILERLDEMGLVRHIPNPSILHQNVRHHIHLVRYINHFPRLRRSDWVTHLDADEFVRVKTGGRRLKDLFEALPDAHIISLSLHSFGSCGENEISTGLQIEKFIKRQPLNSPQMPVKYFARPNNHILRLNNNAPVISKDHLAKVNWVNGSGKPIPEEICGSSKFKNLQRPHNGVALADIAHFAVRTAQGFIVQRDRGSANPLPNSGYDNLAKALKYWRKFNKNDDVDIFLVDEVPKTQSFVEELLLDPELRSLHHASLEWHKNRFENLVSQPKFKDLYKAIIDDHTEKYG